MNTVVLTGRLTADAELKQTPSGVNVCSFRLAVRRPNVKDKTDFISCVAWRGTADFIAKYFSRGDMLGVTGIITSREWKDADGSRRYAVEVAVDRAEFVESKRDGGNTEAAQQAYNEIADDSDLPF